MKPLHLVALLGCLATVFADPQVRWCVTSEPEQQKCEALAAKAPAFTCVRKDSILNCLVAIKAAEADAITLDGGDIYEAGLNNYDLQPIIAEVYSDTSETCYYAVAVAKKNSGFNFRQLHGRKSCHTGLGKSAGWNIPIGTLVSMNLISWKGIEDRPLEEAVNEYFSASCVPGADKDKYSNLCSLCKTDCSKTHSEPYYGYDGAFKCLAEDRGNVAFVKHLTVPDSEKANYELLCIDGTRQPIENYEKCHLARVPAHAVVSRKDTQLAEIIWQNLNSVQGFNLFSSAAYAPAKNLMFKDSTVSLKRVPSNTDSFLYLGADYMSIVRSLQKEPTTGGESGAIKWCTVGQAETAKCDTWSINSMIEGVTTIECQRGETVDECLQMIMSKDADAMALDGGQVYTAGKCGLVPVMVEQYDEERCNNNEGSASYYAVAVVKRNSGVTWDTLKSKRSCHTGFGRTAGWNIPMGIIHSQTQECNFTKYFVSGCAPGSDIPSFCKQCAGSGRAVGDVSKCKASTDEQYYGYAGAFRCLVENAGDVAFIKHTIVPENSNGNGPSWASAVREEDYELICPGNPNPVPISQYKACNLAEVPAHAVVTRPETRDDVVNILKDQQARFGYNSIDPNPFRMFQSDAVKNLIFKDSTKCLQEISAGTKYDAFLGLKYMTAMASLRKCKDITDLEKSCTFHTCQN